MNRFLHLRMEILNAHAQAVEAEPAQRFQMRALVTRGSISMPISASGANVNRSARRPNRSSICAGVRYVGVPPPQ